MQFIFTGAKNHNESGIFVTINQSKNELIEEGKLRGWNLEDSINKNKITILDLYSTKTSADGLQFESSFFRGEGMAIQNFGKILADVIKKTNARRLVIDDVDLLEIKYRDRDFARNGIQGIVRFLENFNITVLLISENSSVSLAASSGIIHFEKEMLRDETKRVIKILKLRGMHNYNKIHLFEIDSSGLKVQED